VGIQQNREHGLQINPHDLWDHYEDWVQLSINGLAHAYGDDEDKYSLDIIKEPNPDYEGEFGKSLSSPTLDARRNQSL
jgi:hypothetical protein